MVKNMKSMIAAHFLTFKQQKQLISHLSKRRMKRYSKIAIIITDWTQVIHNSTLLNPLLGGAFKDPYTFVAIKYVVISNPMRPGT